MTPEIISAIATGIVVILGSFFGFTKWVINKFLKELTPNGGNSLKDQINRLEEHSNRLDQRIDDIYNILITPKPRRRKNALENNQESSSM